MGDGRHAPIAGEDQAHVIAAILEHPDSHDRKDLPIGRAQGDEPGRHRRRCRSVARLGIPVRYEPMRESPNSSAGLTAKGSPGHLVQHLSNVVQDYRRRLFAGTNDYVERIGGLPPTEVATFVRDHRAAFG